MKIYTFDRERDDDAELELYSCKVKETPSGYKALERPGLAFGCRTLFRKDNVNMSEETARMAMLVQLHTLVINAEKEIARAKKDIKALTARTYKRKVSK